MLTGTYSYDTDSRLTGVAYTSNAGANTIDTFGWTYNAANLVTSFTSDTGTASYGYDPTNQLTSASYTGTNQPANEGYSFDLNGNRNSSGYSTGADNLMTSDGTFNYQHDADGNTTVRTRISNSYASDYRTTFTWDYRNRLTDVEYYDNNSVLTKHVHYVYDVFDNLIGEQDDDTGDGSYDHQEFYVVDAGPQAPAAGQAFGEAAQPLLEFNVSQALVQRNLVAPSPAGVDAVMAQEAVSSLSQGGTVSYMVDDNLGSVRYVVNSSGAVIDTIDYGSFGNISYESAPTVAHWAAFAGGHISAATGFENEDERWLNLADGDWLSKDPDSFPAGDTNLSRYAGNDPTNATDPSGLLAVTWNWGQQGGYLTETMTGIDGADISTSSYTTLLPTTNTQMQCTSTWIGTAPQKQLDPLGAAANVAAGWGDTLTFNGTNWIRNRAGINAGIDHSSTAYLIGVGVGVTHSIAMGGAGGLRAAGTKGLGREFSHWIPARLGGPRSIFNGNYVSTVKHALSDPYRYRFMPRVWKAANPMPNPLWQQWTRFPKIYVGVGLGGFYGGVGGTVSTM